MIFTNPFVPAEEFEIENLLIYPLWRKSFNIKVPACVEMAGRASNFCGSTKSPHEQLGTVTRVLVYHTVLPERIQQYIIAPWFYHRWEDQHTV